jgi:hypothetical protein
VGLNQRGAAAQRLTLEQTASVISFRQGASKPSNESAAHMPARPSNASFQFHGDFSQKKKRDFSI